MSKPSAELAPFLLRDPTLSNAHVAFGYGGNIWIANRDGGELRRLTSAGQEGKPALSPDGARIAFVGEYGGGRGVFVMGVAEGQPRRLTHHPDDLGYADILRSGDALGWTPDGKRILFSSRRRAFAGGSTPVIQLFTVPVEGGHPTPVPLIRATQGSFSPDGVRIAYVPHARWQPEWKRYRGGQTTPIWIANLYDSTVEATIPRENSNDFNPMWVGDAIYFLSDRNGPVTLFSYDVISQRVRQVLENDGFDIKSASASHHTIAYEKLGSLHLLNIKTGEDRILNIRPTADFPEVRPHFKNLADIVGSDIAFPSVTPRLSSTGAHAAFAVRGGILTVSAQRDESHNLTRTAGAVERDPAWSPDGESIAYFSDESGEYALHICKAGALREVRKINLGNPPSFYYSPTWSPDGRKIAYTDKRLNHWYVDLDVQAPVPVRIDTGFRVDLSLTPHNPGCHLPVTWSADGRWLAYVKVLENYRHAVFGYSIEQSRAYQLTDGMSDVLHIAFDRAGSYLYFTASTEVGLAGDWLEMSRFGRVVRRGVYALLLNKTAPSPVGLSRDEGSVPDRRVPAEPPRVNVDIEGVTKRLIRLSVPARNYSSLVAGRPGVLFLIEAPIDQPFAGRPLQVHRFDLATQKDDPILRDIIYFDLASGGDWMLYAIPEGGKRRWFVSSARSPADESTRCALNIDSMEVYVDPRVEWKHLFEQVWRSQRDFLYDPGLHGVNLEEIKEKYRPFLENIVCSSDLYYLFGEMLANLCIGHMWAAPWEDHRRERSKTGLLGADYAVHRGRYRFECIYEGDPWDSESHAPLIESEAPVQVGEYLLAVDGREVHPSSDVFSYFENTAGKQVALTVGPQPDGAQARQVLVVPVNNEYPLRYRAWIEGNRRKVDELSGGRVAYVHLPDCALGGYTAFNRYFFAQIGKEAAIIDSRYNNGGVLPDYIVDCLKRPLMCHWHMREGSDVTAPLLNIFGPKVMLINEMSCSMGDILPWMFRNAKLGPCVGKRTWGGSVGNCTYSDDLLDDGLLSNPNLAFYNQSGEWEIENFGVSPDIAIDEDPKAARDGHDVQLIKAVEVVMELLERNPPPKPQRSPYPRYHG